MNNKILMIEDRVKIDGAVSLPISFTVEVDVGNSRGHAISSPQASPYTAAPQTVSTY
jgi:hypothetical protein